MTVPIGNKAARGAEPVTFFCCKFETKWLAPNLALSVRVMDQAQEEAFVAQPMSMVLCRDEAKFLDVVRQKAGALMLCDTGQEMPGLIPGDRIIVAELSGLPEIAHSEDVAQLDLNGVSLRFIEFRVRKAPTPR